MREIRPATARSCRSRTCVIAHPEDVSQLGPRAAGYVIPSAITTSLTTGGYTVRLQTSGSLGEGPCRVRGVLSPSAATFTDPATVGTWPVAPIRTYGGTRGSPSGWGELVALLILPIETPAISTNVPYRVTIS